MRQALFSFICTIMVLSAAAFAQDTAQSQDSAPEVPDYILGKESAPVTLIEYASFTCPHCANFHNVNFARLKADYIDTGKVKFITREVYFDRYGLWAAMLARCAGQKKYYGISDLLYKQQRAWAQAGSDSDVIEALYALGRTAGLDDKTMKACYSDGDMAKAMVETYQKNATKDGINATPSFLINGTLQVNTTYEELSAQIDAALGQ